NAALQQFTAGVITPDGRMLTADGFGLRLLDYSDRMQRQAAAYLYNDLANSSGTLNRTGNSLKARLLLLQTLATYSLSDALAHDDVLRGLLFGRDSVVDSDFAAVLLDNLVHKADWRPTHSDLGVMGLRRIDLLQDRILRAVVSSARESNPANL